MADSVSATSLSFVSSDKSSKTGTGLNVDTETFLKLLVAQMQYQDPLEPQSNSDFVAELAQMTAQQQMQTMNSSLSVTKAMSMVGKEVYAEVLDSDSGITYCYDGIVSSVIMKNDTAYVVVGSNAIDINDIQEVGDSTDTSGTKDTSGTTDTNSSGS